MKGTQCFRNFSISNDLFTKTFAAQMGRGKIRWGAFTSRMWSRSVFTDSRSILTMCDMSALSPHPDDAVAAGRYAMIVGLFLLIVGLF